jgi:KipI family sensor histidine kinase inhibitor
MRCLPIGERALALCLDDIGTATIGRVRAVATAVEAARLPGVEEVVASPGRVTVLFDAGARGDMAMLEKTLTAIVTQAASTADVAGTTHEIPVAYDGLDLEEVCSVHRIDRRQLVALHTEPNYVVEAIGFLPGFGYLAGLPESLATPRRATPRARVPAGAVGIGGRQTGVYPCASPGGWNLIGRSPVSLFDAARSQPSLLAVGDRVRFMAADLPADDGEQPRSHTAIEPVPHTTITVVQPGLFTTVQDLGRRGHRAAGVPLSGAADSVSLRLANLLVGNAEDAAAIECTLLGPTLRFDRDATVALVGAAFPGLPANRTVQVAAGTEIMLGHAAVGCRGVLAVAGGIDVLPVLGSRSTLVTAGFGGLAGRPLEAGDRLAVGEAQGRGRLIEALPPPLVTLKRPCVLRVIPGEQAAVAGEAIWSRSFRASSRSDRMGLRLDGEPLPCAGHDASMKSVAVFPGTVQLPPDGRPIVLLADAQTIGGYPVVGQVIAADLPLAAQLRPGEEVRLQQVTIEEAWNAVREREAAFASLAATTHGAAS